MLLDLEAVEVWKSRNSLGFLDPLKIKVLTALRNVGNH